MRDYIREDFVQFDVTKWSMGQFTRMANATCYNTNSVQTTMTKNASELNIAGVELARFVGYLSKDGEMTVGVSNGTTDWMGVRVRANVVGDLVRVRASASAVKLVSSTVVTEYVEVPKADTYFAVQMRVLDRHYSDAAGYSYTVHVWFRCLNKLLGTWVGNEAYGTLTYPGSRQNPGHVFIDCSANTDWCVIWGFELGTSYLTFTSPPPPFPVEGLS